MRRIKASSFKALLLIVLNHLEPLLSDSIFLKIKFYLRVGYWPNLKNPRSFNEKLQWLKLNDVHPEYGSLVDKASAKVIVSKIIGEEYIIPTLGIYDTLDDINWESLPTQFVLKSTCDSGGVIICKDKALLNIPSAINKLKNAGDSDYSRLFKFRK